MEVVVEVIVKNRTREVCRVESRGLQVLWLYQALGALEFYKKLTKQPEIHKENESQK